MDYVIDQKVIPDHREALDRMSIAAYLRPPKRNALQIDARSSKGKTTDSDSVNRGSNPRRASKLPVLGSKRTKRPIDLAEAHPVSLRHGHDQSTALPQKEVFGADRRACGGARQY